MMPRPGVWVGLGWIESGFGVQTDLASASRLLHRLVFCIRVLVTGRGHVARCNGEASGGQEDNEYGGDGIHKLIYFQVLEGLLYKLAVYSASEKCTDH